MMMSNPDLIALTFRLGEQYYAFRLDQVVEVAPMMAFFSVSEALPEVLGMANRHGELIPIIDLRQVMGLPSLVIGLNTLFIVVKYETSLLGVVVDDILRVEYLPMKQLQQTGTWGKYSDGMMSYHQQTIQFVALNMIMARYAGIFSEADNL
ncbi:MAG: chemotaxis protein CheW [Phototrophicales bacterium]|nr:chemotaxis protein CheW [Phototrophicales bacterium]